MTNLSKELKIDAEPLGIANDRRDFGVLPIDEEAVNAQQDIADTFFSLELFPEKVDIKTVTKENPDWYPDSVNTK